MSGIWTEPIERNERRWSEGLANYPAATSDVLGAEFVEGMVRNYLPSLYRDISREQYFPHQIVDELTGEVTETLPPSKPSRMLTSEEADAKYGIPGHLKFTGDKSIGMVPELYAQDLNQLKREELDRRLVLDRAQGGFVEGAAQLGTNLLTSALDPIGVAASFVPVVREVKYLQALRAASGPLERAAVRFGLGTAEAAVGNVALEPIVYGVAQREQADYTFTDSLVNVTFGSILGGGLHTVGGAIGDRLGISGYARDNAAQYQQHVMDRASASALMTHVGPEARESATRQAIDAVATGEPVDVTGALDVKAPAWKPGNTYPADVLEARRLAAELPDTVGIDTPERQAMRDQWVVQGYGRGAPFSQGRVDLIFGAPASGKTTALVGQLRHAHGALEIDSGRIDSMIPEFGGGIGARAVHEEAADVADRILRRAIENGDNIVYPVVGRTLANVEAVVDQLNKAGYQIHVHFVDLPVAKAQQRAIERYRRSGRFVDPDDVQRISDASRNTFEAVKNDQRISSWSEFSNDVPEGSPARQVAATRTNLQPVHGDVRPRRSPDSGKLGEAIGAGFSGWPPAAQMGTAHTVTGSSINVRYRVVDLSELTTSHTLDLAENPAYPAELQPRERTRAASAAQIQRLASELQPELLGPSQFAAEGAPIVGPDLVVESGNARTLAIGQAYTQALPGGDRYRAYLRSLGFNLAGITNPILVRERTSTMTPAERVRFTLDANVAGVARYSAVEQAKADAQRMRQTALEILRPGDVESKDNRAFVRAFVDTLPENERAPMLDARGRLTADGRRRIEAALLVHAYDDAQLLTKLVEGRAEDPVAGALGDVAGDWARMRGEARAGHIVNTVDTTDDLVDALRIIERARNDGAPVKTIVDQPSLFGDTITPQTRAFLTAFHAPERAASKGKAAVAPFTRLLPRDEIAAALRYYVDQAMLTRPGPTLFGDTIPQVKPESILAARREPGSIETPSTRAAAALEPDPERLPVFDDTPPAPAPGPAPVVRPEAVPPAPVAGTAAAPAPQLDLLAARVLPTSPELVTKLERLGDAPRAPDPAPEPKPAPAPAPPTPEQLAAQAAPAATAAPAGASAGAAPAPARTAEPSQIGPARREKERQAVGADVPSAADLDADFAKLRHMAEPDELAEYQRLTEQTRSEAAAYARAAVCLTRGG